MVVSAKSLPRGNLGRNFAEHRGTADMLQAGDAEVIISTVAAGSRAPGQAKELILSRDLCVISEQPVRRNCAPPSVELCFRETLLSPTSPQGEPTNTARPHAPKNHASDANFPGDICSRHIIIVRACLSPSFHESYFSSPSWEQELFRHRTYGENHTMSNTLLCYLPGDISARHIRPVELPVPLSTTDPPTSPATYAHFNGMDNFVGKDTHNAQFKGNDGDTDHDQFNGNDGFDGKGNFDGNDNDRMIMTLHSTMVVMLQRVAVFALALIAIMPDSMARTILVTVLVRDDKNTDCNGNDNLNFYDNVNVNDNFNDKDSNDSQFNDHDNLYGNGIHSNNTRFHVKDNFGGSVSFEGNDNRNTHSNGNDNLNFNDNFNFNFNDNFDDQERNHSQFNDNYSNDTNSDRFPPPPPRGRKRRQMTLWSSQTGETNTSESGSLVWLPDENSALKAPEHE